MLKKLLKPPSPQSVEIFQMLQNSKAISAKEIGKKLKIFPNAVYRAVKQLQDLGFVEEIYSYPIKFQAKPASEALELYFSLMRQNFQSAFSGKYPLHLHRLLPLTFLQTRDQLLAMTAKDTALAKSQVNLIASGVEVPAETILQNQRAVERGVKVRLIVQNLKEITAEKLENWRKAGVDVRYYPNIEARIFIFDRKVVYFTSYEPANKERAVGMRFDYAPYAQMMVELFDQRWRLSQQIKGF